MPSRKFFENAAAMPTTTSALRRWSSWGLGSFVRLVLPASGWTFAPWSASLLFTTADILTHEVVAPLPPSRGPSDRGSTRGSGGCDGAHRVRPARQTAPEGVPIRAGAACLPLPALHRGADALWTRITCNSGRCKQR